MPCAAVMMKLTKCTEVLFVFFRPFDTRQYPREKGVFFIRLVSITSKHYAEFEDAVGAQAPTMKNVAVVTNLRIYH